jgi:hypothetical protein
LPQYANAIIDTIAPDTPAERRFFRQDCASSCGYPVKDLRLLGRPLHRVVIVDDVEGSALWQPNNLIRIQPWYGQDANDAVLMEELWPLLERIAEHGDLLLALSGALKKNGFANLYPASWQAPVRSHSLSAPPLEPI